jgi:predicted transcriptional regulator
MQKDFNNLGVWLPARLSERQMSVEDLSTAARVSRNLLYLWMRDESRPTSKTLLKVIHTLSETPVIINKNGKVEMVKVEVGFEEALKQFSPRVLGRPKGSGTGVRAVSVRA